MAACTSPFTFMTHIFLDHIHGIGNWEFTELGIGNSQNWELELGISVCRERGPKRYGDSQPAYTTATAATVRQDLSPSATYTTAHEARDQT